MQLRSILLLFINLKRHWMCCRKTTFETRKCSEKLESYFAGSIFFRCSQSLTHTHTRATWQCEEEERRRPKTSKEARRDLGAAALVLPQSPSPSPSQSLPLPTQSWSNWPQVVADAPLPVFITPQQLTHTHTFAYTGCAQTGICAFKVNNLFALLIFMLELHLNKSICNGFRYFIEVF